VSTGGYITRGAARSNHPPIHKECRPARGPGQERQADMLRGGKENLSHKPLEGKGGGGTGIVEGKNGQMGRNGKAIELVGKLKITRKLRR